MKVNIQDRTGGSRTCEVVGAGAAVAVGFVFPQHGGHPLRHRTQAQGRGHKDEGIGTRASERGYMYYRTGQGGHLRHKGHGKGSGSMVDKGQVGVGSGDKG